MSSEEKTDSGLRKLLIFSKLSIGRPISVTDIHQKLEHEDGIKVSLRTVQRDLKSLETKFPIYSDNANPSGWKIARGVKLNLPDFDTTTSVTYILAEKYLSKILPPAMQERLKPYFRGAKDFLNKRVQGGRIQWPEKIAIHSKGLPLESTEISAEVIETVYNAVLDEGCLNLNYCSLNSNVGREFTFHPYGIVVRDERSYLVGKEENRENVLQLALCRIKHARQTIHTVNIPPDFSLNEYITSGELGVIRDTGKLDIKLWTTSGLAKILTETPLSHNQNMEPYGEDFFVSASVDNTNELRHWLLSMCNHATVIEPLILKEEIKTTLINSLSWYE